MSVYRDDTEFKLHFEKGQNIGGLNKTPFKRKQTGSIITWKPDNDVFTDIDVSPDYFIQTLKRQPYAMPLKIHVY